MAPERNMNGLRPDQATIGIVNYRTLECIRLCLRSIRRFTTYPHEVIVVDNDSRDASLAYLKGLPWIRLVERQSEDGESVARAHARGLDLALKHCNTEFFVAMHSDTFVQKENWLRDILGHFAHNPGLACVGSGKIELRPRWRQWLKETTDVRTFKRRLLKEPDPLGIYRYYNRTICCAYRTEVLRRERLSFEMGQDQGLTPGKKLYFELLDRGYQTVELPPHTMSKSLVHLAHATQAFNPDQFRLRDKTVRKCYRLTQKVLAAPPFCEILADTSLDR
ncbi:MAG TPA: glycosyltransferase [Sedimentisphaerales bacterium]|nr:glycosyltransferase [Sedimentisphaerales bacterium]